MRRRLTFGARRAYTILWIGVLACLCFSHGEGLRLMPLSHTADAEGLNASGASARFNISLDYQYATCGLEKSGQKRAPRQQLRDGLSALPGGLSHPRVSLWLDAEFESASYRPTTPLPQPPGRAPPLA